MNLKILINKVFKKFTLLALLVLAVIFRALPAVIEGNEPDYAGTTLSFYRYSDPILKNQIEVFKLVIGPDGKFRREFNTNETLYLLSDFDVYRMMLIVEPQSNLKIKLPPLRKKTLPESKNPYFKPIVMWAQAEAADTNEINRMVSSLEKSYNILTTKYFNQLYVLNSTAYIDTVRQLLANEFNPKALTVLDVQVQLKVKILEAEIKPELHKEIFRNLVLPPYAYVNPTFINLFDILFANKLSFEANSVKAADLNKAARSGDGVFIRDYFKTKYNLSPSLADYVALKVLHDAYYSNQFPKRAIISMLDNPVFLNETNLRGKELAGAIKQKLIYLSVGSQAPEICLPDLNGQVQCLDSLKGSRYLLFVDNQMLVCREQIKYLSAISEKFKGQPGFFIVFRNSDPGEIKKFLGENKIPGIKVLDTPENKYASIYKVRAYPSAFLLNEKNEVVLAPAKNPLDGFEIEFADLLRRIQIEKFRNQR